ncbi:MAG: TolC family protein [Muribaculaceae bacterium]
MRILILMIMCCITAVGCFGQTKTLAECINLGIANNLHIDNARIGISKGKTSLSQSRAKLLPTIQGVAQFTDYLKSPVNVTTGTLLGNDFPDNPTWQTIKSMQYNSNVGIQLTMPLYNQTVYAAIDVARVVENMSLLAYEKAVDDLTVQIAKIYYMAQTSKEQLRLTDISINRMDELSKITEALYEQGVVMAVDLNRVRISSKMLQAERAVVHTLHEQQINMLRFLMNLEADAPLDVKPMQHTFSATPIEKSSLQLPEMKLAYQQKELIEKQIKAVRAQYLPTLSLTGYAGGVGYNEKFSRFADNWFGNCFVGLSLRIPLFEANARKLQIRQYKHDARQAENNVALIQKRIDKDYADAVLQLNKNMDVAITQTECCKQAEAVYGVTENQYKEGVASMTALLQDDMQLRSAQSSYIQAVCQCKLAQLQLLQLAGRLNQLSE